MGVFDNVDDFIKRCHAILVLIDAPYDNEVITPEINGVLQELMLAIAEMADANIDFFVKTIILTPPSVKEYSVEIPASSNDCAWQRLEIGGASGLDGLFTEFNGMLLSKCFLSDEERIQPPVIILLSANADTGYYETSLDELKSNKTFRYSTKAAVDFTGGATGAMLEDFTGNEDTVLRPCDMERLKPLLRPIHLAGLGGRIMSYLDSYAVNAYTLDSHECLAECDGTDVVEWPGFNGTDVFEWPNYDDEWL